MSGLSIGQTTPMAHRYVIDGDLREQVWSGLAVNDELKRSLIGVIHNGSDPLLSLISADQQWFGGRLD